MLPISIVCGAGIYLILSRCEWIVPYKSNMMDVVAVVQPILLFCMLLLTFCRVRIEGLRLSGWHVWLLLFQSLSFLALFLVRLFLVEDMAWQAVVESVMLCFICPTATAAVVVTSKLGGNAVSLTMYTILINLCVALLIPACAPFLGGLADWQAEVFLEDFRMIAMRVFPLLVGPMLLALVLRKALPGIVSRINAYSNAPFYLWAVSLSLAIAVSTRCIVHSSCPSWCLWCIGIGSLLSCIVQFATGRMVGGCYDEPIASGQALGQKNTVLVIWLGYTFFSPITSLAGGFYSIWHNVFNSYQLYRHNHRGPEESSQGASK